MRLFVGFVLQGYKCLTLIRQSQLALVLCLRSVTFYATRNNNNNCNTNNGNCNNNDNRHLILMIIIMMINDNPEMCNIVDPKDSQSAQARIKCKNPKCEQLDAI